MHVIWNGEDDIIKVVMLGESGVGKSSVAVRFVTDEFRHYTDATIGASYLSKAVDVEPNPIMSSRKVTFKIWDTAGQEKFHSLVPMYYRGAGAAILVFDISRPQTMLALQRWVDELKNSGPPDIILALCGNKADLTKDRRVSKERACQYAEEIGAFYVEVSARDDTNVQELFQDIAERFTTLQGATATVCTGLVESFDSTGLQDSRGCC
jgi:small GTP-binding protein